MSKNRELAYSLIESGYRIVPIPKGEKYPAGITKWQSAVYTAAHLDENDALFSTAGIGIICGEVVGIDIDVHDAATVDLLRQWCITNIGSAPERIGREPKTLLVYRKETPVGKMVSTKYEDCIERKHVVEILGKGQQFVAFAIHPGTGKPYSWPRGSLLDIPLVELSTIDDKHLAGLFEYFEEIRPKDWDVVAPKSTLKDMVDNELNHRGPCGDLKESDVRAVMTVLQKDADTYDTWLAMGMALHHEFEGAREGFDLWEEWSQKSEAFQEGASKKKWASFNSVNGQGSMTFRSMIFKANQVSGEQVISTRNARVLKATLEGWLTRYRLVTQGSTIYDSFNPTHPRLNKQDFMLSKSNERMIVVNSKNEPKEVPIFNMWVSHPDRLSADSETYVPGGEKIILNESGQTFINTYEAPVFNETFEVNNLGVFFAQMEYLIPSEYEREWFLDWMAFTVHSPHQRCKVTPLHISEIQGTGRGWLNKVLSKLVGNTNLELPKFGDLCGDSGFNSFMVNSTLCIIEEVRESERMDLQMMERIKTFLEADKISVNRKHKAQVTCRVYCNFMLQSNYWRALKLDKHDRRFNVLTGPKIKKTNEYFMAIYDWIYQTNGVEQLYSWLKRRDLSRFNWQHSIPTEGKSRIIRDGVSELSQAFQSMMEHPPLWLMKKVQINEYLRKCLQGNSDYTNFTYEVKALRDAQNLRTISVGKGINLKKYYVMVDRHLTQQEIDTAVIDSETWKSDDSIQI